MITPATRYAMFLYVVPRNQPVTAGTSSKRIATMLGPCIALRATLISRILARVSSLVMERLLRIWAKSLNFFEEFLRRKPSAGGLGEESLGKHLEFDGR